MDLPLTPNELELLLYCYTTPAEHPRYDYVQGSLRDFLSADIIQHWKGEAKVFTTTDKGNAWVKTILATSIPTQVWVDSSGEIIK